MGKKKVRILFLIHTLQIGGAEKILVNLANSLNKDKYDITVMTVCDFGDLKNELNDDIKYNSIFKFNFLKKFLGSKSYGQTINASRRKNPIKTLLIDGYKFFWRKVDLNKFYKRHIKETYDIEISFLEGIPAKIISHSSNPESKKIVWLHVDLINENKSDAFFNSINEQKEVYSRFNKIVCVSNVVKETFCQKYDFDKRDDRICVLYNPINEKEILEKSTELVQDYIGEGFTFCTVGRLAHQKGYDRLLKIVKRLNDDNLSFNVKIIGVGAEESKLKELRDRLGIKNVDFLGYKKNPYPYIKRADAFVCSSRAEGFSTVVSEAVILGKPIVTTDCSGMREILGDNSEYGLICDNNDDALYEAMKRIIVDKRKYDKYAKDVLKRRNMFNYDFAIHKVESFFRSILDEKA